MRAYCCWTPLKNEDLQVRQRFRKSEKSRICWPICGITGEIVGLSTCWALNHTMKATLIILTMLASVFAANAQQPVTATAEDGRKVLLYPNGQ